MADISKINGYNIKDATARALIAELQAATGLTLDDLYDASRGSVHIVGTTGTSSQSVAIGGQATVTIDEGTAIGHNSHAQNYAGNVAVGKDAYATGNGSVQLGEGTNSNPCVKYKSYIVPHYAENTLTYASYKTEEGDTFYAPKGHMRFYGSPNLRIAWGAVKLTGSSSSATSVSMSTSFTSKYTYIVLVAGQGNGNYNYSWGVEPYSTSGFKIKYGSSSAVACRWIAIGY